MSEAKIIVIDDPIKTHQPLTSEQQDRIIDWYEKFTKSHFKRDVLEHWTNFQPTQEEVQPNHIKDMTRR